MAKFFTPSEYSTLSEPDAVFFLRGIGIIGVLGGGVITLMNLAAGLSPLERPGGMLGVSST